MNTEYQRYLQKKLSTIIHYVLKEWETEWCNITAIEKLNDFNGEIIGRLFEKFLNYCKSEHQTNSSCSAKEIICAIQQKSLIKVKRKGDFYSLSFPNYEYEIENNEQKFRVRPVYGRFSYMNYPPQWVAMNKDAFVYALFEFDAFMPIVKERIEKATSELRSQMERQCNIAETINKLSEDILTGNGIICKIHRFERDGRVCLSFYKEEILPIHKLVDPKELDTFFAKVPVLMKKRPFEGMNVFGRYSCTVTAYFDWASIPKDERWDIIDYFTVDSVNTHLLKIKDLGVESSDKGMTKVHFNIIDADWVYMLWNIEKSFPNLNATYMIVARTNLISFKPNMLFTNDVSQHYFQIEDMKVKVIEDFHEIRKDCDNDKTNEICQRHQEGPWRILENNIIDDELAT